MIRKIIEKYPLLVVLTLAFFVRVILYALLPVPEQAFGDFHFYKDIAVGIVNGDGFGDVLYVAPGWPVFLSMLYFIFGSTETAVLIGHIILGVLITLGTYMFAVRVFSKKSAFISGLVIAFWPISLLKMFYFSNGIFLYSALLCFSVIAFWHLMESNKVVFSILTGFLLGLGALTDPVGIYIPIVFIACLIFKSWKIDKKRILVSLVFVVTFIATLAPWAYRNSVVFRDVGSAPLISKSIEKQFMQAENIPKVLRTFSLSEFSKMATGLSKMFLIPDRIDVLDRNTDIQYKQVAKNLLLGQSINLSKDEMYVFLLKIGLFLTHVFMVGLAVCGLFLSRTKSVTKLIIFTIGYVTFATIVYASILSYKGIAPLSEFFFPFLPFVVTYASYVVVVKVYPFLYTFCKNHSIK